MSYKEFAREAFALYADYDKRHLREGQFYCNVLYAVRPDLGKKVIDARPYIDCFFNDAKIVDFFDFIEKHWDDEVTIEWL
jgi:hypothetical protein